MIRHATPRPVFFLPLLLALLGLPLLAGPAAAQDISGSPAEERSATDTGFDSPEFSPQQRATMALASGQRNLKSGAEAAEKAAAADSAKKREKLEKRALKSYERAASDFRTVVQIQPQNTDALVGLGTALARLERYEEALPAYNQALAAKPEDAGALMGRAQVFLGLDRPREAAASYNLLLPVDAGSASKLLAEIKEWTAAHRTDPAGIDPELLKALDEWIAEKEG